VHIQCVYENCMWPDLNLHIQNAHPLSLKGMLSLFKQQRLRSFLLGSKSRISIIIIRSRCCGNRMLPFRVFAIFQATCSFRRHTECAHRIHAFCYKRKLWTFLKKSIFWPKIKRSNGIYFLCSKNDDIFTRTWILCAHSVCRRKLHVA
jgi:hypothetical protein